MSDKPKVIAVVGATASGKTSLSIQLAKKFNGEVISADSRQVYQGMYIGTGKVTNEEMNGVPHHLLDLVPPTSVYTAADFERDASAAIQQVTANGHVPIVAGGTFFYLDLLRGTQQAAPVPPNETLRQELELLSTEELFLKLEQADKARAAAVDQHNRRRLIRSLEIIDALGSVPPVALASSPYEWLIIGIDASKEYLQKCYKQRIDSWLQRGFKTEVETLLTSGVTRERLTELGFEYTLMLAHLDGELSESELRERFVQKNWQYAKRQLTWLRRDEAVAWFTPTDHDAIVRQVETFLAE